MKFSFVEPLENKGIVPEMTDAAEASIVAIEYARSVGVEAYLDGFPLCLLGKYSKRISNLRTEDIRFISEIYEDTFFPADEGNKGKADFCKGCHAYDDCEGIYTRYIEMFDLRQLRKYAKEFR